MRRELFAAVIAATVRGWLWLLRVRRLGATVDGPGLIAFWHGDQLPLLAARPRQPLIAPISQSRDGRLQAKVMRWFGVGDVPGSSSRGGLGAARRLLRGLRAGQTALMAVDGPRGPRGVVQPGVIWLAAATGLPVWPVGVAAAAGWRSRRAWDRFLFPRPLTRVVIVFGAPLRFERGGAPGADAIALTAAIEAATAAAEAALGGGAVRIDSGRLLG